MTSRMTGPMLTGLLTAGSNNYRCWLPFNEWSFTSTPQYVIMAWYLIKQWLRFDYIILN